MNGANAQGTNLENMEGLELDVFGALFQHIHH